MGASARVTGAVADSRTAPGVVEASVVCHGRRLIAANVWFDMQANGMSREEAAENRTLPAEAVSEIIRYCDEDAELLVQEADEKSRILRARGYAPRPEMRGVTARRITCQV